jgi:Na+-transporting methylmalonyl-CoA/oxaloacetate decarboxylase gamma subunit
VTLPRLGLLLAAGAALWVVLLEASTLALLGAGVVFVVLSLVVRLWDRRASKEEPNRTEINRRLRPLLPEPPRADTPSKETHPHGRADATDRRL